MPHGPLELVANPMNQAILSLLAVEPTYPRRISNLLGMSESEVARHLKQMELAGLVQGQWSHIGKNVKLYRLATDALQLRITPQGVQVSLGKGGAGPSPGPSTVNPFVAALPEAPDFVGRGGELEALDGPEPVVVVEGMPGIGKTSLLARYAQREQARRPVFWHSFRGVESLTWLANRMAIFHAQRGRKELLEAVERGAELADRRALMLHALDDPGHAVVLDDVHRVEDEAVRAFLAEAVEQARRGKLVLGTRERPRYDPSRARVRVLRLAGLGDPDVRGFLERKGMRLEAALLPKLREEVGGHPLALNLLLEAAGARGGDVRPLLDRVPEEALHEYLLQEIDRGLAEDERDVMAHASVFRTRFALEDLAALSRRNPEGPLLRLRRRLLVEAYDGTYALHEVLRNFFYQRVANRRELHERAALHYMGKEGMEDRLEAMHHWLAAGKRDRVLDMLEQDLDLHDFGAIDAGYHHLYDGMLGLFARAEVKDPRRWALVQDERGDILFHRGEFAAALERYAEADAHFREAGAGDRLADLAWKRAMAQARLGRKGEARALCAEGLALAPAGRARERLEALRAELGGP